jgi:nitrate/nitrite-specific signal transduction histidine kinase
MATGIPPATTENQAAFEPGMTAPALNPAIDPVQIAVTQTAANQTIDLQQQVARLQALLEASRQVHSTTHENEVLESVLRIVVRELEMAGAAFSGTELSYGDAPRKDADGSLLGIHTYPLDDREGNRMTELVVTAPEGRPITLYEADFLEGLALQAAVALENARNHERNLQWARVQQDLDAPGNAVYSGILDCRALADLL